MKNAIPAEAKASIPGILDIIPTTIPDAMDANKKSKVANPDPIKVRIQSTVKKAGLFGAADVVASNVSDIIINFELHGENNIFIFRLNHIVKKSEYFFIQRFKLINSFCSMFMRVSRLKKGLKMNN